MLGKETPMTEMKRQLPELPPAAFTKQDESDDTDFYVPVGWSVISTTRQLRRSPPITEPSSLPGVFFST